VVGVAPCPAGALLIATRKQWELVDNKFTFAQVCKRQHRDLFRWRLLIVGGNRELGAPRIDFNDAVVPGFSTMRRYLFFGHEEWPRLVLRRRRRATDKQKRRR
jgi:hypothetical protein